MCAFFSLTSDGEGNIKYFNWEKRKKRVRGELNYITDSHTSINEFYGYKGASEDSRNKYEYNPLTGIFEIDQINTTDDRVAVEKAVRELDFTTIVEPLIIKPIVQPFKLEKQNVSNYHIFLLKKWISIYHFTLASVQDSTMFFVGSAVLECAITSIWRSVGYDTRHLIEAVVKSEVYDSIWVSVWAYASSFFKIEKWQGIDHESYQNPFQPCIDLWEMGIVPSFDGKVWRLHSGKNADIIYEIQKDDMK